MVIDVALRKEIPGVAREQLIYGPVPVRSPLFGITALEYINNHTATNPCINIEELRTASAVSFVARRRE